nr:hypothetical protein [Tanacetum cinerariifolium]
FQNTSEPSDASTNVVNAPREPNVVKQDNGSFVDKIIFRAPDSPDQFHCFHCKDVLRAGETCKRCTCAKCRNGLGKGLCYICGHNQNSLNDSSSISEISSKSPPNINHCCYECGDPLDGIFCKRCPWTVEDKILVPKPPKNCARCTRCGYLVDGPNCQGCALLCQELEENLVTHSLDFQNSSEPSNASTNVVNAPRELYVVKQDNESFVDKNIFRAPDSPDQFHCFHCKDVLRAGEACK